MPVVINYKICDLARECGGIAVCPTKAFFWNEKTQRPDVDNNKCTSCGLCSLECPVGAILVARTPRELAHLKKIIANDPRLEKELWRERLGTQPGRTPPKAAIVTPDNFQKEILQTKGLVALDVWSEATLDCRYHSLLWENLGFADKISLKKLDGGKHQNLLRRLKVTVIPTLIFFNNGQEQGRRGGYLYRKDEPALKQLIRRLIARPV